MSSVVMVVPADHDRPTGGNRYNRSLCTALGELGTDVELRPAPGRWPVASPRARDGLTALLYAEDPVLVDGLVAGGAPRAVSAAVDAGARVFVLVHLPLALETGLSATAVAELDGLERQALRAATGVLATSAWAARDLRARHDVVAGVARPGTDPAPAATGSVPPRILHLAAVTERKDQLGVVEALAGLRDRPWTADLTGPLDADPAYVDRVRAAVAGHGLEDRIRLTGPVTGPRLEAAWRAADLLLLPSRAETWGLAVTEALARGVPAVVARGTGAEEALGADETAGGTGAGAGTGTGAGTGAGLGGAVVPAADPAALARAVADLLGPGRDRARRAARERGAALPTWSQTARDVLSALAVPR
jgi:glycosyltransferase involved in cell wall biosynthesis